MNTRMGMQESDINNRTCVELDVGGQFSNYTERVAKDAFTEAQALLNPNYIDVMVKQLSYNDQRQSEMTEDQYADHYLKGDQMQLYSATKKTHKPFFVPQAIGFNGICMNTIGTSFLNEVIDNECQQYITDLKVASETYLSPLTYISTDFGFTAGVKSRFPPIKVDVGGVWILNSEDNTLTRQESAAATTLLGSNPTYTTMIGCSVTNAVKEVFYTVTYGAYPKHGYVVKSVSADFILQDTLEVGAEFCEKTDLEAIST